MQLHEEKLRDVKEKLEEKSRILRFFNSQFSYLKSVLSSSFFNQVYNPDLLGNGRIPKL